MNNILYFCRNNSPHIKHNRCTGPQLKYLNMKVKVTNAIKQLFGTTTSFDMVYYEAVANSLDANAKNINILIEADSTNDIENFKLTISDDGIGFTDNRYSKFGNLFDAEEASHRGVGRLVYLAYFDSVKIKSFYEDTKLRTIDFKEDFDETKDFEITDVESQSSGTTLVMTGYNKSRIYKADFLSPTFLKKQLLEYFCFTLYDSRKSGRNITINIEAKIGESIKKEILASKELPNLLIEEIPHTFDLFNKVEMLYLIEDVVPSERMVKAAVVIDGRSYPINDVLDENAFPSTYRMLFLLSSDSFKGKTDSSRLRMNFSEQEKEAIRHLFRITISKIIKEQFPQIREANDKKLHYLKHTFPHLCGYIDDSSVGFINQRDVLQAAENKFFKEQREILNAKELTDEQFDKSLKIASRSLMQYILFRQRVIERLKKVDKKDKEKDIHNSLIPMKEIFMGENLKNDLYRNNIWVLDDKFMTYKTILSDKEMTDVISAITDGEVIDKDNDRPDIALIFSGNPNASDHKVDVVIVELKKKGIDSEHTSIVEVQLENRARKLYKYYNNRIQRVWYYGIVECIDDYILHLRSNEYKELFSHGRMFYRPKSIAVSTDSDERILANIFILDIDAVVNDADSRNATFLEILRSGFDTKNC